MKKSSLNNIGIICGMLVLILLLTQVKPAATQTQNNRQQSPAPTPTPTLGLDQGYLEFDTPDFKLKLVKASQTIAALQPKGAEGFDFTPADRLERRAGDGFYHLGDLTLRLRAKSAGSWQDYS